MSLTLDLALPRSGPAGVHGAISVAVADRFETVEPIWRRMEADAVFTPYQRYEWQALFHRHFGADQTSCLVVLSDESGARRALLPLAIQRRGGLGIASFIGAKHANFHMGLWDRAFAASLTTPVMARLLREIAASSPERIDVFAFSQQPREWDGMANPLALLPHQPAASDAYKLALGPDADAVLGRVVSAASRRKLRKKERTLAESGPVAFTVARTADEVRRLVDTFLAYKGDRLKELGIGDPFAVPGMRGFLLDGGACGLEDGRPLIEYCALTVGDTVLALYGGTASGGRFTAMFNAITNGPLMRLSPGELLLHHLIRHCCERGLSVFDLGTGEARYKANICDGVDTLFSQFIGVTAAGRLAAVGLATAARAKRTIKQTPALWALATRLRRGGT